MSLWCDEKYLRLLSGQLERFVKRGPRLYNCRCPFCGDSTTSQIKARGYFFPKQQVFLYKCHNCTVALPFAAVLKRLNRTLYDEYVLESFDKRPASTGDAISPELFKSSRPLRIASTDDIYALAGTLPAALEPVRAYVQSRQLPVGALSRLYTTHRGHTWLSQRVGAEKSAAIRDGVPYLIIPLCVASGDWYGAQFRTLDKKEYLTFRWAHDELNRTFGLDAWNPTALTYCVEGPLDALCVPNALAFCGSDLLSGLDLLRDAGLTLDAPVLVWDNEPRNTAITKQLRRAIDRDESVVIWPKSLPAGIKDLNDCVARGIDISELLSTHTYRGLRAALEFRQWLNR